MSDFEEGEETEAKFERKILRQIVLQSKRWINAADNTQWDSEEKGLLEPPHRVDFYVLKVSERQEMFHVMHSLRRL